METRRRIHAQRGHGDARTQSFFHGATVYATYHNPEGLNVELDKKDEPHISDWVWVTTLPSAQVPVERAVGFGHQRWDIKNHGFNELVEASELLPRVHLVASLLKRWLLGTHQGAVSRDHLEYYLDEFT